MRIIVLMLCLLAPLALQAQQPSRTELERRRQSILESIRETQSQLEATKQDKRATLGQLRALQAKLNARQRLIGNINQEIGQINNNIQTSSQEIAGLQQKLEQQKKRYAQSVRYTYQNRNSYNMLAFLFAAESFNDAMRRFKFLKKYREYRRGQVEAIVATQNQLNQKIGLLNSQKQEKDQLLTAEEQQRRALLGETQETNQVVNELKGREKELLSAIQKNRKAAKQLDRTIQALIQREIQAEIARKRAEEERQRREEEERRAAAARAAAAAANNGGVRVATGSGTRDASGGSATPPPATASNRPATTSRPATPPAEPPARPAPAPTTSYSLSLTPEVSALSDNFEQNQGRLPWPVEKGFIAEGFGKHKHPVYNIELESNGVEIQTSPNAGVRAVFDGTVTSVVFIPGMGQVVVINHGRYFTSYARLGNVSVKKGDKVRARQQLGNVAPNDNGEHMVHFELWKVGANNKSAPVNPAGWIAR